MQIQTTQYILKMFENSEDLTDDLMYILLTFSKTCHKIAEHIRDGDSQHNGQHHGTTNNSGDQAKNLDIWCNEILKKKLSKCSGVKYIASEEDDFLIDLDNNGSYLISYDPLDGSGNIDVNITVGTIFTIFKLNERGFINNGHDIVAAGYYMYSQSEEFILANSNGAFCVSSLNELTPINIPSCGSVYSINESNKFRWHNKNKFNNLINKFIEQNKTQRWVGCLVADAHRILIKGGFFAYPSDEKNKEGRIRLVYEAYPMAYIFEKSGGRSSHYQDQSILDVTFPYDNIHRKIPIILSSIDEFESFISL